MLLDRMIEASPKITDHRSRYAAASGGQVLDSRSRLQAPVRDQAETDEGRRHRRERGGSARRGEAGGGWRTRCQRRRYGHQREVQTLTGRSGHRQEKAGEKNGV